MAWKVIMLNGKPVEVVPPPATHEAVIKEKVRRWKVYREPRDQWVGRYIGPDGEQYICPLPTLVIKTWVEEVGICPICGANAHKTATDTGEGWFLGWECEGAGCLEEAEIPWPFGDREMSAKQLRDLGYEAI